MFPRLFQLERLVVVLSMEMQKPEKVQYIGIVRPLAQRLLIAGLGFFETSRLVRGNGTGEGCFLVAHFPATPSDHLTGYTAAV
jgi:hypothetical protein